MYEGEKRKRKREGHETQWGKEYKQLANLSQKSMEIWGTIFTIFLLSLVKVSKVETKIKLSPKNFKIS